MIPLIAFADGTLPKFGGRFGAYKGEYYNIEYLKNRTIVFEYFSRVLAYSTRRAATVQKSWEEPQTEFSSSTKWTEII